MLKSRSSAANTRNHCCKVTGDQGCRVAVLDLAAHCSGSRPVRPGFCRPRAPRSSGSNEQITLTAPVPHADIHVNGLYQDRRRKASDKKNLKFRAARAPESLCKGKVNININREAYNENNCRSGLLASCSLSICTAESD